MKFTFLFCLSLFISLNSLAGINSKPYERPVILSGSTETHVSNETPLASFIASGELYVYVNPEHYSSYTIRLTPGNGGTDIVVAATSATVSIPVVDVTTDYVVTVDGGDYGTYDGLLSPSNGSTITLNDMQAMQLVKNRRANNADVHFYSATVNSVINDRRCPIDTMPTETWATDTTVSKLLIYVDEHPATAGNHDCVYYYLPQQLTVQDSVGFMQFTGNGPSRQARLKPLNFTFDPNWQRRLSFTPNQYNSGSPEFIGNPIADNMSVIIYGAYYNDDMWEYLKRWNECSAFYNILTQQYGIPKSKICVVMPDLNPQYNLGSNTISHDFDGDGIDEFDGTEDIYLMVDSIVNLELEHFIFYYAREYEFADWYLQEPLYFNDIPESILDINANYKNYILSCFYADRYAEPFTGTNTAVTVATTNDVLSDYFDNASGSNPQYYQFPFCWLSVLSGVNLKTGNPIISDYDLNHDGHLSMKELQLGAKAYALSVQPSQLVDTTSTVLGPQRIVNQLSFDTEPQVDVLTIHQSDGFTPSQVTWDSPDIWFRKNDDGLLNQKNECFTVASGDSIYIYVRVHNEGNVSYNGSDMKLHLFWEAPHLGIPGYVKEQRIYIGSGYYSDYRWKTRQPNLIATDTITETIPSGQCAIIKYKWGVPDEVIDLGNDLGHILTVNLGAMVSNISQIGVYNNNSNLRRQIVQKNNIVIDEDFLPTLTIPSTKPWMLPQIYYDGKFKMVLYPNENQYQNRNLTQLGDTAATIGNVFTSPIKPYLQGYHNDNVNVTPLNYDQYKLGLNGLNSQLSGMVAMTIDEYDDPETEGSITWFGCSKPNTINASTPVAAVDQTIHLVPTDNLGNIYEGQAVRIIVHYYNPTGGGTMNPLGIHSVDMSDGIYSLSETNVNEPARYEWLDGGFEKFGEGKSVIADKSEVGEYAVLRVTRNSDGKELYAVAALDGVPTIANVTPVPFDSQININLTAEATEGMSIRIISVLGLTNPIEQPLQNGQQSAIINTTSLPSGQYVISLLHNNEVIESVNVIK